MKKDASPAKDGLMTFTWRKGIVCALITLVGFNLRSVILAVPGAPDLCRMDVLLMNDAGKSYGSKLPSDKWGILGYIRPLLLVQHIFGEHTTGQYILSLNRHQI